MTTEHEYLLADEKALILEVQEIEIMLEKAKYDLQEVREKIKTTMRFE